MALTKGQVILAGGSKTSANNITYDDTTSKLDAANVQSAIDKLAAKPSITYTLTQDKTDGHKITLTPSEGSATTITIPDNVRGIQDNLTSDSTVDALSAAQGKALKKLIDELPDPMVFKGSLGTGGTITALPTAATTNIGFTYKVITDGTYASQAAKVGDTFISDGTTWVLIPSGDEPSGTVTSVGLTVPTGLEVSGSPITDAGTLAVTYATGYSIPTDAKQDNWDAAYTHSQANHAPADAEKNVQSDWDQTTDTADDFIKNKPTLGTAAAKNAATTIAAASTSTDLPTSAAVAAFVEGKGYKTTDNNTTYTLTQDKTDGHKLTFTPSSGEATTITIPDNDTDTKVTAVGNHYTPSKSTTKSASGGTLTDIANSTTGIQVVTGVEMDATGHVTGVTSVALKATNTANTDRYVNTASFADDSTATAASPVKMTLTRAGSDTATVTGNIPKVSSTSAGVVPKGASVTTQSQTTKFLREDGTWAVPSYTTNTDTKNTAGSTDTSSKIYLVGATSQDTNPQTYSDNQVYVTNGTLFADKLNVGTDNTVTGANAIGEGINVSATGYYSHAEGGLIQSLDTIVGKGASKTYLDSLGVIDSSKANGDSSHAQGIASTANGIGSHAEGVLTYSGVYPFIDAETSLPVVMLADHAEGFNTSAIGGSSHAEGYQTYVIGAYGHAEGINTSVVGNSGHAEGQGTYAELQAHAEGDSTYAFGEYSHTEGQSTSAIGPGSHAEGESTYSFGLYSHTEGYSSSAEGVQAHAEGCLTCAVGIAAHAEGGYAESSAGDIYMDGTFAIGYSSHAEGYNTSAFGNCSHVEGSNTYALANYSHAEGKYNAYDAKYAHMIGNGISDTARSNAFTVAWTGDVEAAGDITSTKADGTKVSLNNRVSATVDGTAVAKLNFVVEGNSLYITTE